MRSASGTASISALCRASTFASETVRAAIVSTRWLTDSASCANSSLPFQTMRGHSMPPDSSSPSATMERVMRVSGLSRMRLWTQKIGSTKMMPPSATKNASCQTAMRVAAEKTRGSETDSSEIALPEMSRSTKTVSSCFARKPQDEPSASSSSVSVNIGEMPARERTDDFGMTRSPGRRSRCAQFRAVTPAVPGAPMRTSRFEPWSCSRLANDSAENGRPKRTRSHSRRTNAA